MQGWKMCKAPWSRSWTLLAYLKSTKLCIVIYKILLNIKEAVPCLAAYMLSVISASAQNRPPHKLILYKNGFTNFTLLAPSVCLEHQSYNLQLTV